jgi:hypothetical protein
MTINEAQNILKNPLKFGDAAQIAAKKLLQPYDMPLTFENVIEFIGEYEFHKARTSPGWEDIWDALNNLEESVKDDILNSI